jgi:hypothetical protein
VFHGPEQSTEALTQHVLVYYPSYDERVNASVGYLVELRTQWLRHCAINRKVTGLIADGVIGIFH